MGSLHTCDLELRVEHVRVYCLSGLSGLWRRARSAVFCLLVGVSFSALRGSLCILILVSVLVKLDSDYSGSVVVFDYNFLSIISPRETLFPSYH